MCKCRDLRADEIDVRVQSQTDSGLVLLLYKNARVDMDILDETYGELNWQRTHEFKDGKLYCTVSIWDKEKSQWICREDVGTESNTEAEKGQASDSFKRANVNFGIGRELYTSPFIFVKNGNYSLNSKGKCKDTFSVAEIAIEKKVIIGLAIKNDNSKEIVYTYGRVTAKKGANSNDIEKPKQVHQETNNEPKKAVVEPNMTYEQALEIKHEGRTLREIYKSDRAYVQIVYEQGTEEVKKAITVIEAYLAEYRAKK